MNDKGDKQRGVSDFDLIHSQIGRGLRINKLGKPPAPKPGKKQPEPQVEKPKKPAEEDS